MNPLYQWIPIENWINLPLHAPLNSQLYMTDRHFERQTDLIFIGIHWYKGPILVERSVKKKHFLDPPFESYYMQFTTCIWAFAIIRY